MTYWWVNQNQTYEHEVGGGYLWSPKRNNNNSRNQFYENMTRVQPGDVVFSFARTRIGAVGIVQGTALSAPKPTEFGTAGANWTHEGWLVPVRFTKLARPIRPKDHIQELRPTLPSKYSPIQASGDGLQSVYLAEVPDAMAAIIEQLLDGQVQSIREQAVPDGITQDLDSLAARDIEQRGDIPETMKQQLVMARRGQGLFRARLEQIERRCRVTGVSLRQHLRASHAKPWRLATDAEKLDGNNGLLLAPHIDHLFDAGYLTFADNGDVLYSTKLAEEVRSRWGLASHLNVGPFAERQKPYLAFHRQHVFLK